jgi:hypothetical protein
MSHLSFCVRGAIVLLILGGCVAVRAETHYGRLDYLPPRDSSDELEVTGRDWPDYEAAIEWWVTDEQPLPGFSWKYTYRLQLTSEGKLQGAISHVILEISEGCSREDFAGLTGEAVFATDPVGLQTVASGKTCGEPGFTRPRTTNST